LPQIDVAVAVEAGGVELDRAHHPPPAVSSGLRSSMAV
jgi:hypothetical protein